ncbi:hypothetical protein BDL97_07G028500 [Sphagnum fallax]|nr:hypothetical protein BDL97_07G028500 [Sphagnum fallax]
MRLGSKDDTKDNCSCHNPFFLHHRLAPIFLAAGLTEEEVQTGYVTEDATIPTSKGDALICTVLQSKVLKESEGTREIGGNWECDESRYSGMGFFYISKKSHSKKTHPLDEPQAKQT